MATLAKFQARVRIQKETIKRKDAEIRKLKEALRVFASGETDHSSDSDIDILDDIPLVAQQAVDTHSDKDSEEEETDCLPEPIWIDGIHFVSEGIYICVDCAAEVVDGYCCSCGLEHEWEDKTHQKGAITDTQAIHSDRSLVPRGNTPLFEVDDDFSPPVEYGHSRIQEYMELLKRGATRLMCETFHLEYTHEGGIYAWADSSLYTEFAGPAMKNGHFWKIHLGRRIALDDDDLDGSAFIEGLLEDALYFSLHGKDFEREFGKWETVQETQGIWVTRLQGSLIDSGDRDGDIDGDDDDDTRRKLEDEALEHPEATKNTVSSIRLDEYDTTDDSEGDDYEMNDLGYSWQANVPDAVWVAKESDVEKDQHIQEDSQVYDDHTMSDSDDYGSDLDSDEITSDDE